MEWLFIFGLCIAAILMHSRIQRLEDDIQQLQKGKIALPESKPTESLQQVQPEQGIYGLPESPKQQSQSPQNLQWPLPAVKNQKEVEFQFSAQTFTAVGIIAVVLGVGFFLRYAFENNLISESARVMMGLLAGSALIGGGSYLRKTYQQYGEALTGGGLALLYLSLFAGYNLYSIIPQPVAFIAMVVVTIVGVVLAIMFDSLGLAAFALLGGFITPFLVSSGENRPHALFSYIALLDIGVLVLAGWRRTWQLLVVGSVGATLLIYTAWFGQYFTDDQYSIAFLYTSIFFGIFLLAAVVSQLWRKEPQNELDVGLAIVNPALYFIANYWLIDRLYPELAFPFVMGLGILHVALGIVFQVMHVNMPRVGTQLFAFGEILLAVAVIFFVIAVPVQFDNEWFTIGWAVEGLVLTALGFQLRLRILRLLSFLVFGFTVARLVGIDAAEPAIHAAWVNTRFFTFAIAFVCYAFAIYIHWLKAPEITADSHIPQEERTELERSFTYLLLMTYAVLVLGPFLEIWSFHDHQWLGVWLSVVSLPAALTGIGLAKLGLRMAAYISLITAGLLVFAYGGDQKVLLFNMRVVAALVLAVATGAIVYAMKQNSRLLNSEEQNVLLPGMLVGLQALFLWLISFEIADYYDIRIQHAGGLNAYGYLDTSNPQVVTLVNLKRAMLSVSWTFYAILLLVIGIIQKSNNTRRGAIVLFSVVVFKVFLYDTANLNDLYRFISFITLGCILLIAGYLYYRFKERITEFIGV